MLRKKEIMLKIDICCIRLMLFSTLGYRLIDANIYTLKPLKNY